MQRDIERAVSILEQFQAGPQPTIPERVLRNARGLAFLTVYRLSPQITTGQVLSGIGGKGIMVARTASGWSAPLALASGSAAFGGELRETLAELILVINDGSAVQALSTGENVTLGTDVTVAPGPRSTIVGASPRAAAYFYMRRDDPSIEDTLDGVVVAANEYEARDYYGGSVSASAILSGQVKPPKGTARLIELLQESESARSRRR
jgi:lipid-binding SYLF domain-containing protein